MSATIATLNRLLQLHSCSLVVYLAECSPWTSPASLSKAAVIREIAESQRDMIDRIADCIMDLDGATNLGEFPLHFTRFNDLSFDYLLGELVTRQRQAVQAISTCVAELQDAPEVALAVAEEAHGAALGYLDRLVEVSQVSGAAT